jgi:hypothetical protein
VPKLRVAMVEFEMDLADKTPCGKILLCSPFSETEAKR